MKNATGVGPRQRRQVQAMLGREFGYLDCPVCPVDFDFKVCI